MKKIFIKAYSQNNLGDDLFIYILCQRYPMHSFIMPCAREFRRAFEHIPNLKTIPIIPVVDGLMHRLNLAPRPKRAIYRELMKRCDATVHIGGSLFIESMFPLSEIAQYAKDVQASQQYYLLGLNFGPFIDEQFFLQMRDVFEKVDDICFREQYSYDLFKEMPNVRLAPDIVFGLDTDDVEGENESLAKVESDGERIVVSVIDLAQRPGLEEFQTAYEDKMVEICDMALAADLDVTLMSFCDYEGDNLVMKRLNQKLACRATEYSYQDNLEEALAVLNSAKGIVATRFHALILAWVLGRNVYPICYSSKMTNVIEDVHFPGGFCDMQHVGEVDAAAVLDLLLSDDVFDISEYKAEAARHFEKLDLI